MYLNASVQHNTYGVVASGVARDEFKLDFSQHRARTFTNYRNIRLSTTHLTTVDTLQLERLRTTVRNKEFSIFASFGANFQIVRVVVVVRTLLLILRSFEVFEADLFAITNAHYRRKSACLFFVNAYQSNVAARAFFFVLVFLPPPLHLFASSLRQGFTYCASAFWQTTRAYLRIIEPIRS